MGSVTPRTQVLKSLHLSAGPPRPPNCLGLSAEIGFPETSEDGGVIGQLIAGDRGNQSPVSVSGLSHLVSLQWRELEEAWWCSGVGLAPATEFCTCLPPPQRPDHGVAHSPWSSPGAVHQGHH